MELLEEAERKVADPEDVPCPRPPGPEQKRTAAPTVSLCWLAPSGAIATPPTACWRPKHPPEERKPKPAPKAELRSIEGGVMRSVPPQLVQPHPRTTSCD